MQTQTVTPAPSAEDISLEELEAMMAAFDEEIIEEKVPDEEEISDADILLIETVDEEIIEGEIEESELAKAIKAISNEELAGEIYAEQVSEDDHVEKTEGVVAVTGTKEKREKKAKTPRATVTYASRDEAINAKAKSDFHLLEKADLKLDADGQKAKHDEVMTKINAMNVKVGAKCVNLLSALNGSAKLSTFIESGIRYICNADTISSADFIDYFMKKSRNGVKSYEKGTASPQATNLLKLFTEMKLLEKAGTTYAINDDSLLFEHFEPLYVKSAE